MPPKKDASSPKTPKAQNTGTPKRSRASTGSGSGSRKRKVKDEEVVFMGSSQSSPRSMTKGRSQKMQKIAHDVDEAIIHNSFNHQQHPTFPIGYLTPSEIPTPLGTPFHPTSLPTNYQSPISTNTHNIQPSPQAYPQQLTQPSTDSPDRGILVPTKRLFYTAVNRKPALLPSTTITSTHLHTIAYAMWQLAHASNNGAGDLLWKVSEWSVTLDDATLQGLASLNFLPSWYFMRKMAVQEILRTGLWEVDDGEMAKQMEEAVRRGREMRRIHGEKTESLGRSEV